MSVSGVNTPAFGDPAGVVDSERTGVCIPEPAADADDSMHGEPLGVVEGDNAGELGRVGGRDMVGELGRVGGRSWSEAIAAVGVFEAMLSWFGVCSSCVVGGIGVEACGSYCSCCWCGKKSL